MPWKTELDPQTQARSSLVWGWILLPGQTHHSLEAYKDPSKSKKVPLFPQPAGCKLFLAPHRKLMLSRPTKEF